MKVKFNHTGHKALWTWLSENPHINNESEWVGWSEHSTNKTTNSYSFACQYDEERNNEEKLNNDISCIYCPFGNYSDNKECALNIVEWYQNKDKRKEIAVEIAKLPLRTDIEIEII